MSTLFWREGSCIVSFLVGPPRTDGPAHKVITASSRRLGSPRPAGPMEHHRASSKHHLVSGVTAKLSDVVSGAS